ncbi:MAG TPA: M23 family metallopeptidase [Actinomycetota bacterium]
MRRGPRPAFVRGPALLVFLGLVLSPAASPAAAVPDTTITSGPSGAVASGSATFEFASNEATATFECSLDAAPFTACSSPATISGLAEGAHTFGVRAVDARGVRDPDPASREWIVDLTPPETTITSGPSGTVPDTSVTFEFSATEEPATFECGLDGEALTACVPPKEYSMLVAGSHEFRVRAIDAAGNADGSPASRTFAVEEAAEVDLCPGGRRPAGDLVFGCSAGDVIREPGLLLDPAAEQIGEGIRMLGQDAKLADAIPPLDAAMNLVETAGDQLGGGKPCAADGTFGRAAVEMNEALELAGGAVAQKEMDLAAQPREGRGDVEFADMDLASAHHVESLTSDLVQEALDLAPALGMICDALSRGFDVRGVITGVDDSGGTFRIGRRSFLLPHGVRREPIYEGETARVVGRRFGDGTSLADRVIDLDAGIGRGFAVFKCIDWRVAPIQPAPGFGNPWTLHHPSAYRVNSLHLLETGQRVGAEDLGCKSKISKGMIRYSLKVDVEQGPVKETIATDLRGSDTPVQLPEFIGNGQATLIVTTQARSCTKKVIQGGGDQFKKVQTVCGSPDVKGTETYQIKAQPLGHYATAFYDETEFSLVDDEQAGEFESVKVTGVNLTEIGPGIDPVFSAKGYRITGGMPANSYVPVAVNQEFAIFEHTTNSGLIQARIAGSRNGKTFWYSAALPEIQKDMIAECPPISSSTIPTGPPRPPDDDPDTVDPPTWPPAAPYTLQSVGNSYYELPFPPGFSPGTGLVNIDDPTASARHPEWQAYALDLGGPLETPIHAARGGTVTFVEESDPYNFDDPERPDDWTGIGNYLFIRHEDGTYAVYFHITENGVFVDQFDTVHRGDVIAEVGNTGGSSGPHVHIGFATTETHNVPTDVKRVRFHLLVGFPPVEMDCYIPRSGDKLFSSNV